MYVDFYLFIHYSHATSFDHGQPGKTGLRGGKGLDLHPLQGPLKGAKYLNGSVDELPTYVHEHHTLFLRLSVWHDVATPETKPPWWVFIIPGQMASFHLSSHDSGSFHVIPCQEEFNSPTVCCEIRFAHTLRIYARKEQALSSYARFHIYFPKVDRVCR